MRLLPLPGVFQPHSDSYMLADRLARERLGPRQSVLDLCTGSGLLAVTAARRGAGRVVAVDVSRRAILAARLNARLNGVRVEGRRGDLFAVVPGERFDLIVSNPPYLPSATKSRARGAARAWDAGPSGRLFIDRICERAAGHLKPGGALLLVHSSVCGERQTLEAIRRSGLAPSVVFRHRGPLGELLRARSQWLREQGLLTADGEEELLVIRAS